MRVKSHLNSFILQSFFAFIVEPGKGSRPTIFPTPPVRSVEFRILSHLQGDEGGLNVFSKS